MSTDHVELRAGAYADSVTLLQVSRQVQQLPGVVTAQVAMATPLNVEVLERMGFTIPADATVNHLVVAVRLDDADGLEGVRVPRSTGPHRQPPRGRRTVRGGRPAHDRCGTAARPRCGRPGVRARRQRGGRGDGRPRGRQRRDGLQRQRAGRAGGRAQDLRRRARPARDGPGLRHRRRRRGRARLRQRRRARTGRDRRRLGHRLPAGAGAARPRRRRRRHGVRRRRPRPVRRRRRPLDPHRAGPARRRPRRRARAAGLQATRRRGRRIPHVVRRRAGHPGPSRRCSGPGDPTSPPPPRRCCAGSATTCPRGRWPVAPSPGAAPGCTDCSSAARSRTRPRCCAQRPPRTPRWSTSATTTTPRAGPTR